MILLFILVFVSWAKIHKTIRIGDDQGYEGFVIGISNTVKRDLSFVAGMSDKFTRVSKELWDSSNGRTFISEITIVLPENWEEPTEEEIAQHSLNYRGPVSGLSFDRMAMQVHHATDDFNPHRMYAIKVTPCGHFGKHIRATDNYIKKSDDADVVERHGRFEKVFVREFAKLRWGVFDETVNKDKDEYIFDSEKNEIIPAKCSRGLIGTHVYKANFDAENTKAGDICEEASHKYHGKCHFIPNSDQTPAEGTKAPWIGSFMYSTAVKDINTFCRDSTNDALGHEWRPNTIHNKECDKKSVWEVITNSPDFQQFTDSVDLGELKINIVRDTARRIVLAIDMSTSMQLPGQTYDRYFAVRKAAVQFLETVSLGTYIGLISFDKGSRVHSELMKIEDEDSRTVLIKRLPRKEDLVRGTSIGAGILTAIEVLEETGPEDLRNHGGEILLITDGAETVKPHLSDILEKVSSSGVTIHAISLGSEALYGVEIISEETGGLGIFTPATVDSRNTMNVNLQDAFKQQFNGEGETLTVSSEAIDLEDELEIPFVLDDSIGLGTKIFVTWPESVAEESAPELSLELPSGATVDKNSSDNLGYSFTIADTETNSLTVKMPDPSDVGRYTVKIKNPTSEKYSITVAINSFPRDQVSPVKVTAYSMLDDDDRPLVYVEVSQGMYAVIGATVDAQYIHPELDSKDTTEQKYSLHDDGDQTTPSQTMEFTLAQSRVIKMASTLLFESQCQQTKLAAALMSVASITSAGEI
ncbi:Oidioi.mRNA.OKI2018_I69.XSR.g14865.t1.cds [Oikopleura dioica]|uniref:Oidioi.mRNA.OKI2018_I69.XSR.g14865.t1.cds n=1 Tax=Oikopleura dioica TaxID=34765 RepID=A0ABN7SHC0_OIKDI|nr:Oidioi.mRNA.OKI2018_I69.XSR.g14865.t1.cds [Oikopleura dioica]